MCISSSRRAQLEPGNEHLETHGLMDEAQRGAHAGCSGTMDNLLIERTVTLNCHPRYRNLKVAWIDVKKVYDSVDRGWLEEIMILQIFPATQAWWRLQSKDARHLLQIVSQRPTLG